MNLIRRLFSSLDPEPVELERDRKIFAASSGISRRQFLRTAGVLGSAILVAPKLIAIAQPADYGRSITEDLNISQREINEIFRRVYADALAAIPDASPLFAPFSPLSPRAVRRLADPSALTFKVRLRS